MRLWSIEKLEWNDFSKDTSVAESHDFIIIFQIFLATADDREYLGEFPIHYFFVRAKMGDNYEIISFWVLMRVSEIYENKILQMFNESENQIGRKL